jgi:hypothetical protein
MGRTHPAPTHPHTTPHTQPLIHSYTLLYIPNNNRVPELGFLLADHRPHAAQLLRKLRRRAAPRAAPYEQVAAEGA